MIRHLACIMDGNRRWARDHNWLPWLGHKEGIKAAERVIDFCLDHEIPILSLYTFSQENFNRPQDELAYLFGSLPKEFYKTVMHNLIAKDVRVQFIGDRTLFPASVASLCEEIEQKTKQGKRLSLNLLFCYGGQQEIVEAVKQVVNDIKLGVLEQQNITPQTIENYLWTSQVPSPDLIIRTGGAQRLSNFFLYKSAYSELFFLDCLWPDINADHLNQAITYYQRCQRNFGV